MFHRLWTLIRKELQSLLREPQTRAILIMPVLIQVLLFPFAATLEVTNATIAIYNEDSGLSNRPAAAPARRAQLQQRANRRQLPAADRKKLSAGAAGGESEAEQQRTGGAQLVQPESRL